MKKTYLIITAFLTCNYACAQTVKTVNQKGGKTSMYISNINTAAKFQIGNGGITVDGKSISEMPSGKSINIYITGNVASVSSEMGNITVTGNVENATSEMGDIKCNVVTGNAHTEMGDIINCK